MIIKIKLWGKMEGAVILGKGARFYKTLSLDINTFTFFPVIKMCKNCILVQVCNLFSFFFNYIKKKIWTHLNHSIAILLTYNIEHTSLNKTWTMNIFIAKSLNTTVNLITKKQCHLRWKFNKFYIHGNR